MLNEFQLWSCCLLINTWSSFKDFMVFVTFEMHELPIYRLNVETIMELERSVRKVIEGRSDWGDILRGMVEIDISTLLSRGRKVLLNQDKEAWVPFKYEKFPYFFYWCSMILHDDKEYDIWLASKGHCPSINSYEAWLCASYLSTGLISITSS